MPWDPLQDLRSWQERLERLSTPQTDSWTPPIDVYETAEHYVIAAEVPGLAREEIEIALEEFRLTLSGRRTTDSLGTPAARYHQVERGHGSFTRTFDFAAKIDVEAVTADLALGVLTVKLTKAPPPPPARSRFDDGSTHLIFVLFVLARSSAPGRDRSAADVGRRAAPTAAADAHPPIQSRVRPPRALPSEWGRRAVHRQRHQHLVQAGRPDLRTRRLRTIRSSGGSSATRTTCSAIAIGSQSLGRASSSRRMAC